MPSPFPGMDPYLEGYLWPDVHHALASKIRQLLTPQLPPNYVARLEIQVITDESPESEIGIMYPDVEIVLPQRDQPSPEPIGFDPLQRGVGMAPMPLTIPLPQAMRVRYATVQLRDVAKNSLITNIEVISPVNKREPHLSRFREKRDKLYEAGVHMIEIDLIRRGRRTLSHPRIPKVPYLVSLTRSRAEVAQIWPIRLQDALPTIPVPLRSPDSDVTVDLQTVITAIYDEAAYERSIDYTDPAPPPPLSEADKQWVASLIN